MKQQINQATKKAEIFNSYLPRIFKAGTPKGMDFDIGIIVKVLPVKNIWIKFWKFDIFINDQHAKDSFIANRAMEQLRQEDHPKATEWAQVKSKAAKLVTAGTISDSDYSLVKCLWHKANGLPHKHYAWKTHNAKITTLKVYNLA